MKKMHILKEKQHLKKSLLEIKKFENKKFSLRENLTDKVESKLVMKENLMEQMEHLRTCMALVSRILLFII